MLFMTIFAVFFILAFVIGLPFFFFKELLKVRNETTENNDN